MKNNPKIYPYIFAISLIYFIIYATVYFVCFSNSNMLYELIIKYKTYMNLPFNLDESELKLVANSLMEYLSGKTMFLDTKVHIKGILTDFYSINGKIHMGDVRFIFQTMKYICYGAIALCIFSIFKVVSKSDNPIKCLKQAYNKTLIFFVVFILIWTIFAMINFDAFFTVFHKILFRNDFWIFDPNVDYVINLLPEEIFIVIGIKLVLFVFIALLVVAVCFQLLSKIQPRQEAK